MPNSQAEHVDMAEAWWKIEVAEADFERSGPPRAEARGLDRPVETTANDQGRQGNDQGLYGRDSQCPDGIILLQRRLNQVEEQMVILRFQNSFKPGKSDG